MKKYAFYLFIATVLFSCQSKLPDKESNAECPDDEIGCDEDDGCTYWTSEEYTDTFGEPTGESYLQYKCIGNFSNSMVDNEPLFVDILVDKDELYFRFYVYDSKILVKNRGLLFADVKFDNGKVISFALNNQGLGKTSIVRSSADPRLLRDMFLIDGQIKFHVADDKLHPTSEYIFLYDGMAWDFEQSMDGLGLLQGQM